MKGRGALIVVLIASSFMAGACAHAASTRTEYIAQADPICAEALAGATAIQPSRNKAFDKQRYKQAARKLRAQTALYETMVLKLAALQPPAADAALIDSWLNAQRDLNSLATRQSSALAHRKLKRFTRLQQQVLNEAAAARRSVADYGFSACGQV